MSEDDKVQIAILTERVNQWMLGTDSYRQSLCEKMTELKAGQVKMFQMMYDLPCKARAEATKWQTTLFTLMWGAIGITFALLAIHLKWQ